MNRARIRRQVLAARPEGRVATVTKDYQGSLAVRFDYTYDTNFPEKVISIVPKNPTTNTYDPNWQAWQYAYYPPGSAAPGALYHVDGLRDDGTTADTIATYTYDTHGRVLSVTDAVGAETDYGYDAAGNHRTEARLSIFFHSISRRSDVGSDRRAICLHWR